MDFGLGLILSFTDKASAGIQGAIVSLNNLQQAAENSDSKLGALGNALTSLGSLGAGMTAMITAPITAFMGKIVQYGIARASFVEDMHLAFTSLMGDAQTASNYMQSLMNFAKTTPYTYEGITSAAQLLISYGFEAENILSGIDADMDGILDAAHDGVSEFGGLLQAIGDWAGATGRGESAMSQVAEIIGKINAEGKVGTMRLQQLQLAGIQASDIIGNMYDMTTDKAAEFIKTMDVDTFVNDLVRGLEEGTDGINGMTGAMAGQMMNLKKTWTGAKDTFVSSLKTAGLSLMGMYTDEFGVTRYQFLEGMTSSLNNLSAAVKLIPSILQPLMDTIQNIMNKGSELVLKFAQAWDALPQPMKTAIGKILGALVLIGPALLAISKIGGGVLNMFATLKKFMGGMSPTMLKFAGTLGLVALMWKSDFLGMRTNVTWFVDQVRQSFATAKDAVSGDVNHLREVLSGLDKNNFFDNLSIGIMKLMVLFQALKEGWSDFTLSEDTFLKAKELGILPLIEAIFDLKYRFDHFKEGFIEGWNEIKEKVTSFISSITEKLKGTFIGDALEKLTGFLQKLTNNDPESWKKAGHTFAYIATGLIALWGAVKLFKGVATIFGAGKSVGSAITNLLGIGKGDKTSALSSSGGGFLANPAKVAKTMGSIAIILGGATVLLTALGAFTSIPMFKQFLNQGFQDVIKLFENIIPLVASIGALGLLAKAFEALKISPTTAAKGIADFAILLGGMEVLITAMGALNSIPMFDDFLNNGISVTNRLFNVLRNMFDYEVLGSIALIALFGNVPVQTAALGIANLAIILGGLDVLITAMGALNSIPGFDTFLNSGIEIINKVFDVLRSMFDPAVLVTIGLISAFGLVPVAVTALGLANLAIVLGGITAVISAFSALSMIDGFDDFISHGGDTLANLFGQLGKIVGTAIAEFGSAVTSTLPDIGTNIAGFAENVKPFFEMTQDTDFSGVSTFMGALSEMFLVLTGEQIISFFTGGVDLPAVGQQLADFATAAEPFFTSVASMSDGAFENASKMFAALDGLNNYSFKSGGLAQFFTGELALDQVGTQLSSFTENASSFFSAVEGISETAFTNAQKMFESLAGLDMYEFKSGGVAQFFTGTLDLGAVGEQLSSFATSSQTFFDSVSNFPEAGFTNATKVFESLAGLDLYEFKSGGVAQFFTGTLDLEEVGSQLSAFATSASTFFETVSGMDESGFTNATKMFEALNGLDQYEFKSGGVAQFFTGTLDLGEVGTQLSSFATSASDFFDMAGSTSAESITAATNIFTALGNLNEYDFKSGGIAQWFTGSFDIASVGEQLSSFATSAETFFNTAATISDDGISRGEKMLSIIATIGDSQGTIDAMGASWGSLSSVGSDLGAFATNSEDFWTAASSFEEDTATKGASMLGIMSSLDSIPEGTKKIKDVGSHLSDFATKSEGFFTMVSGLDDATISRGSSMATMISDITTTLQSVGDNNIDLTSVTTALTDFATTLTQFATDVSAMPDFSKLTEFTTSLSGFGTAVTTASTAVSSGMNSITTSVTSLETAISTKFGTMSTTVTTKMAAIKTSITTAMSGISTDMTTKWTTIGTTVTTKMTAMNTSVTTGFNTMKTTVSTATSAMSSSVSTNFTSIKNTISSMMSSAVSSVTSGLNTMKNAFANTRFSIPQHHISLPHISVSGSLNATSNPPSVPSFSVSWYKKGGIFDSPSIIGVGEQGKEAVMPLERNTAWIGMLAQQIGTTLESTAVNLTPTNTPLTRGIDDNHYVASGGNSTTYGGDTDNSITFAAGAIQINCQNASEEEARKMAKYIMQYIERQQELKRMTSYA